MLQGSTVNMLSSEQAYFAGVNSFGFGEAQSIGFALWIGEAVVVCLYLHFSSDLMTLKPVTLESFRDQSSLLCQWARVPTTQDTSSCLPAFLPIENSIEKVDHDLGRYIFSVARYSGRNYKGVVGGKKVHTIGEED